MARVTYDHVTKRFGDRVVVDGLNLDINEGEFLVLVVQSRHAEGRAVVCGDIGNLVILDPKTLCNVILVDRSTQGGE